MECRLASRLHIAPLRARRMPLALGLLWLNYAAQEDGMETWWVTADEVGMDDAALDAHIEKLRAGEDALQSADYDYRPTFDES